MPCILAEISPHIIHLTSKQFLLQTLSPQFPVLPYDHRSPVVQDSRHHVYVKVKLLEIHGSSSSEISMNLVCPGRSSGWPCFSSQRYLCRRRRLDWRFDKRDSCNWTLRCSSCSSRRVPVASRPVPRVDRCRARCWTTRTTARSSRNRRRTWCSYVARPRWWSRPRHRDNRDPSPGCRTENGASLGARTGRGNSVGPVSWRNRSSRRRRTGVADRLCQFQVCLAGNSLSESWSSTGRNRMSPPGWPSMSCARSDASPQFLQRWISSLLDHVFSVIGWSRSDGPTSLFFYFLFFMLMSTAFAPPFVFPPAIFSFRLFVTRNETSFDTAFSLGWDYFMMNFFPFRSLFMFRKSISKVLLNHLKKIF